MPPITKGRREQHTTNRGAVPIAGPIREQHRTTEAPSQPTEHTKEFLSFEQREFFKFAASTLGQALPPGRDVATDVRRLLKELGFTGRVRLTSYKGRDYVVLSGYPGLRKYLTTTRYRPDDLKIVKVLVGNTGRGLAAVKGVPFSFLMVGGADVFNHYMTNEEERQHLGITIAVDVAKNVGATVVGLFAAAAVATVTSVAIVPVAAGVVVAIAVGLAFDRVAPTEDLVAAIQKQYDSLAVEFGRRLWEVERGILESVQFTPFPY
jgi:hypothetical protein